MARWACLRGANFVYLIRSHFPTIADTKNDTKSARGAASVLAQGPTGTADKTDT